MESIDFTHSSWKAWQTIKPALREKNTTPQVSSDGSNGICSAPEKCPLPGGRQKLHMTDLIRTEPVVDPQLPSQQAGFRRGRSTVDQVTLLTQDIEDSFQDNDKAGVVFLDLTAAYDTVWHRGLHVKLLRTIPDWHMERFIIEMQVNCSFIVHISDGQTSRL
ncbi:hypothetical protein AOLI_G00099170 [Acnodon oligacanthus]